MPAFLRSVVFPALMVAAAMLALSLAGCGESEPPKPAAGTGDKPKADAPPAKPLKPVSLQLNWIPEPQFGGFYAAGPHYEEQGLKVDIIKGGGAIRTEVLVDSGKVDFGIVDAAQLVSLRSKGGDLVAVFAAFQTNPQGIMVHESRGVKSIEELIKAGGTIAVQLDLAYVQFFKKKYDMSNVKLVPYQGGIAQIQSDPQFAQQCFVTSEPLAAEAAGLKVKSFVIAESGFNPYATVVITRGKFLKENRETVEKFVKATRAGWKDYVKEPTPANIVISKSNPAMDLITLANAADAQKPLIKTEETDKGGLGTMSTERWQTLIEQLVDLGVVEKDKAPKAEDCFENIK